LIPRQVQGFPTVFDACVTPGCYTEVMEAVPGHTNLFRRGAVYYHRCKVPTDIVESYGRREVT